eukprot:Polyplicarium_translucidae@DN3133_c0_g1_i4.p1
MKVIVAFAAALCGAEKYTELHRPQFHFSPAKNWMNDPNGMVFSGGKYHQHYQYHPWGDTWGPMHWGHAESTDLIHWEHKPIAIHPDEFGTIFSGGGTVIADQTQADKSGLAIGTSALFYSQHCVYDEEKQGEIAKTDPLALDCLSIQPPPGDLAEIYVQHQSLVTTTDHIRYTKHASNPIIVADLPKYTKNIRDPKVFWHDDAWYMILANQDRNRFFKSENLVNWEETEAFGGNGQFPTAGDAVWECPDLFKVGEDWIHIVSVNPGGNPDLKGSGSFYFMGTFDAESRGTFKPDSRWASPGEPAEWLDAGIDNYAGLVWNNVEGDPIFTGWMSNWAYGGEVPTSPWRSAMTLPRKISAVLSGGQNWLRTMPHSNVEKLRCDKSVAFTETLTSGSDETVKPEPCEEGTRTFPGLFDVDITVTADTQANVKYSMFISTDSATDADSYVLITVDGGDFKLDRSKAGTFSQSEWDLSNSQVLDRARPLREGKGEESKLRVLVDRSSVEVFVDDGDMAVTALYFLDAGTVEKIRIANDGDADLTVQGSVHSLASIWDHDNMYTPEDPDPPSQSGAAMPAVAVAVFAVFASL